MFSACTGSSAIYPVADIRQLENDLRLGSFEAETDLMDRKQMAVIDIPRRRPQVTSRTKRIDLRASIKETQR